MIKGWHSHIRASIFALASLPLTSVASAREAESSAAPVAMPPQLVESLRAQYRTNCGDQYLSHKPANDQSFRLAFEPKLAPLPMLSACDDPAGFALGVLLATPEDALTFLANRAFKPFWGAAETAWGNDLGTFRQAVLGRLSEAQADIYAQMLSDRVTSVRSRARILTLAGKDREALTMLDAELAHLQTPEMVRQSDYDFDRVMLVIGKASALATQTGPAAAAAEIEAYQRDHKISPDYALNLDINRAAFLAEAGSFAQSLALIDASFAEFAAAAGGDSYKISGSNREFAWIKACALTGLGRVAEAKPYVATVGAAAENPQDEFLTQTKPSTKIKLRMYRCMNDEQGYFDVFRTMPTMAVDSAWLLLDPNWRSIDRGPKPGWLMPADVAARYAKNFRPLPQSYHAALARWVPDAMAVE